MIILTRPVHVSLRCFVDPKGDINTNSFIASQLAQQVTTDECLDFACIDILGNPYRRNVWSCPNWLVDELLANRCTLKLNFDLYVREKLSDEPPHFALSLEEGQKPEDALRAILDDIAIQVPCAFDLSKISLAPSDFAFLLPSTKPSASRTSESDSARRSTPGLPPRYRRDKRKW